MPPIASARARSRSNQRTISHGHEQLGRSKHLGIGPLARAQPSTRCKGPRSVRDAEQEHHLELEALRTVECADFDGIGELASVVLQVHAVEAGFPEGLHRGVDIVVGRRKCAEIAKAQGSVGAEGLDRSIRNGTLASPRNAAG